MYLDDFKIFKTFRTKEEADELKDFFAKNSIPVEIIDNSDELIGSFYTGNEQVLPYQFLIPGALIEKANDILLKEAENNLDNIPSDYYLYSFTTDELYDIILKPDEWGELDMTLAQKILNDRGVPINDSTITALNKKRLDDLRKPDDENKSWIAVAYLLAFLGGLLGIILGHFFWNSKKTLPNGEKVYRYAESQRLHGRNIFILGVIFLILWIVAQFGLTFFNNYGY